MFTTLYTTLTTAACLFAASLYFAQDDTFTGCCCLVAVVGNAWVVADKVWTDMKAK